jgi:colanic acid/amylovoran biosynthesis glycosyltransferase
MTRVSGAPRLLSIVNQFPSESETFIESKARALTTEGFDVTVAAFHTRRTWGDPTAPTIRVLQLPRTSSPRTWGPSVRPLVRDRSARRRVAPLVHDLRLGHWLVPVAAGGYDIIHFEFSGIAAVVVELLRLLRPARLAVSCRGAGEQIIPHANATRADRLKAVFDEVDLIHCVSEDMAQTAKGLGAPAWKILVNRPAVETARWRGLGRVDPQFRGARAAPLRMLSVGRLHWKKGFDDAVRAVAAARSDGVHIEYRIAGDGPELEKLLYLRHSLDLEAEVAFVGWQSREQVEQLFGWADLFLLPSLSEGISNAALEALAAGLPLVSTRCGGMEEALDSPAVGLLVDVGATDQIVTALHGLCDPDRRRELAIGGAAAACAGFDLARQAEVFSGAYQSLLAEPGS